MCDSSDDLLVPGDYNRPTGIFPSTDEFAGYLNFELLFDSNDPHKSWQFSHHLKKVFIDRNRCIGITFRWNAYQSGNLHLFVRALPVYTQNESLCNPVERCPMHMSEEDNQQNYHSINHVLHCDHERTMYHVDSRSERKSCITPVASGQTTLNYRFVCKTSCLHGMERRPVVVIFTLEDANVNVLGRRCLQFKICSCVKRDLEREERLLFSSKPLRSLNMMSNIQPVTATNQGSYGIPNIDPNKTFSFEFPRLTSSVAGMFLVIVHNILLGEVRRNNNQNAQLLLTQVEHLLKSRNMAEEDLQTNR